MPALALPEFWAAVGAGGAAVGEIGAAKIGSSATQDATTQQIQYQRDALAAQVQANQQALQFQQSEAARNYATAETNRQANYGQWASREGRLSALGQNLGMPGRDIPGYVPLPPYGSVAAAGGSGAPAASGAPTPGANTIDIPSGATVPAAALGRLPLKGEINWNAPADQLRAQLQAYQKRIGQPVDIDYTVGKAAELAQRGQELGLPDYAGLRLAGITLGGSPTGAATQAPYGSIAAQSGYAPLTPSLTVRAPVPGSLAAFAAAA